MTRARGGSATTGPAGGVGPEADRADASAAPSVGTRRAAGAAEPGHALHAHVDAPAGVAGDMLLGALVDAGWPEEGLASVVRGLGLDRAVSVRSERVIRSGLAAVRVAVEVRDTTTRLRTLAEVEGLLDRASLAGAVVARSRAVFRRLAEAEAGAHGTSPERVHFHELGSLDTVVDVCGVVAGLHALGATSVSGSALPTGDGWVHGEHGPLPVPAPATLRLLASAGASLVPPPPGAAPGAAGELVTPTAAALLAELCGSFGPPRMALEAVGHGAGSRETPWPNVVRLWLGRAAVVESAPVVVIETVIDDMVPELYGHVAERLLDVGALDVTLTPNQMKKGRPGVSLSVLAPAELEATVAGLLLAETTTFGVRVHDVRRHVAARATATVETPFGALPVKLKLRGDRVVAASPEHDACRAAALALGVTLVEVYGAVAAAARDMIAAPDDRRPREDEE